MKSISPEDAVDIATTAKDLAVRGVIQPIDFTELDFSRTFEGAFEERLTFYDASYIVTAEEAEATLVTEDNNLLRAVSKFMEAITYSDLESRLS